MSTVTRLLSRWLVAIVVSLMVLLLSGCWDRIEVNDLAIITAVGMDRGEDSLIELTVHVVVPMTTNGNQQMGGQDEGSQSGGGAQRTIFRSAQGRTIAEALSKLQLQFPRRLFWGHTEVIIIGEELARTDIRPEFDYILRHPQLRIRSFVFVGQGKAKKLLSQFPAMERDLAEMMKENAVINAGLDVTTKELAQMLIGDANAAAIPYVKILPAQAGQSGNGTTVHIDGTAVFKDGMMVGAISERATRGLLWIKDKMERATITIRLPEVDGYMSLQMFHSKTRLKPIIRDDKWQIRLMVEMDLDVYQNATKLEFTPKGNGMLEQAAGAEVEDRIREVLELVQKKMKTDIFGFAETFHRGYPAIWKQNKDRWDEIFPNVEVIFDIKAKVKRPGLVKTPVLIPQEDIIKVR